MAGRMACSLRVAEQTTTAEPGLPGKRRKKFTAEPVRNRETVRICRPDMASMANPGERFRQPSGPSADGIQAAAPWVGGQANGGQPGWWGGGEHGFRHAGTLRLFTQPLVGEASWLLPFGLGGLVVLALALWKRPLDEKHASVILWAGWLLPRPSTSPIARD
jgi:hypothetical protein